MSAAGLPNLTLPACALAPRLLGCRLACRDRRRWRTGVIVETEAYPGGDDRASHTFGGRRTERNGSMWLEGGHAYVYFVYGMHYCVNVVSGPSGSGEAVLIRALEPLEGVAAMRRGREAGPRGQAMLGPTSVVDLCRGPARLTRALGIDRRHDGAWLLGRGNVRLLPPLRGAEPSGFRIAMGSRIGVTSAGPWSRKPWRYWQHGNPHVSAPIPPQTRLWRPDRLGR